MGSKTTATPKSTDLNPVPWDKIEPHFKAGIRSVKSISTEFGVSRAAIYKHAEKQRPPWIRSLKPQIIERAAELVTQQPFEGVTPIGYSATESQTIEVNAQALAIVQHAHRTIAGKARAIGTQLLTELGTATNEPELFARVAEFLALTETEEPDTAMRQDMADVQALLAQLPRRVGVFKTLIEALSKVQGMEREAFGLNAEDGTGGNRFTVIVKDYTGQGSGLVAKPADESDDDR